MRISENLRIQEFSNSRILQFLNSHIPQFSNSLIFPQILTLMCMQCQSQFLTMSQSSFEYLTSLSTPTDTKWRFKVTTKQSCVKCEQGTMIICEKTEGGKKQTKVFCTMMGPLNCFPSDVVLVATMDSDCPAKGYYCVSLLLINSIDI